MRLTGWTIAAIALAMLAGCLEAIWRLAVDQDQTGPLGPRT